MPALPKTLPDDIDALKALLIESQLRAVQAIEHARTQAQQEIERNRREFEQRLEAILEQLRLARRRFFGASSERHIGQDRLFDVSSIASSCALAFERGSGSGAVTGAWLASGHA